MSSALRAVRGNPGRRRQTKTEPTVPPGIPDPPEHLSGVALEEWHRLVPILGAAGLLTALDRAALAALCSLWARVVACEEDLQRRGTMLQGMTQRGKPRVYPVQNPSLGILRSALPLFLAFAREFGMSPASRSRIQVEAPAPLSAVEAFMRRHAADHAPGEDA
jgi:P27 family predicted phage terminase small subunit